MNCWGDFFMKESSNEIGELVRTDDSVDRNEDIVDLSALETYMNDFRYIPKFTSQKQNELFNVESSWLREKVNFYKNNNKKVVVMTHHLPISDVVDIRYAQSNVNESYAVLDGSCDDILPDFWIHGHSHCTCKINKNGCIYIRNPIGYRILYGYDSSEVIWHNWYDTVIEV